MTKIYEETALQDHMHCFKCQAERMRAEAELICDLGVAYRLAEMGWRKMPK